MPPAQLSDVCVWLPVDTLLAVGRACSSADNASNHKSARFDFLWGHKRSYTTISDGEEWKAHNPSLFISMDSMPRLGARHYLHFAITKGDGLDNVPRIICSLCSGLTSKELGGLHLPRTKWKGLDLAYTSSTGHLHNKLHYLPRLVISASMQLCLVCRGYSNLFQYSIWSSWFGFINFR